MTNDDYKNIAPTLPANPGIYKFVDNEGIILYVGKAKNLKKRLASYFGNRRDRAHKVRVLVKNSDHIEFTLVETETDALLLENTLIKKYQPRYNVMLKDGKSYSYICIKSERFPRVIITRKVVRDGSTYFGPYTSRAQIKTILELLKTLFPLRTCSYNLSQQNIDNGKFKLCLEYHIKNCEGPCVGLEKEESYNKKIAQIKNILRGHFGEVRSHFKAEMRAAAEALEFEKAQQIKDKLGAFNDYQGRSTVVSTTVKDVDVFSIAKDEKYAYVNYLKVVNGAIIHTHTQDLLINLDDDEEDLLAYAIPALRERFNSISPEIVLPFEVPLALEEAIIVLPQRGDKKKLLELSQKNVKYYLLQKQKQEASKIRKQTSAQRILEQLKTDLRMEQMPLHIECFDNSNMQGSYPVASCVVFKNARPSNKDYRHFNIKTVQGSDDFASMEEVVYRRYKRLLNEEKSLPQLVIIDGGKGQLSAAVKSAKKLGIENQVLLVGIAKRLEEIYFAGDPIPLHINKKSESLKLIQQLRNEAHRFAINFHRDQRSRDFTKTALTDIAGIGDKTAQKLLTHFGSVKKLKEAGLREVSRITGAAVARKVKKHFEGEEEE